MNVLLIGNGGREHAIAHKLVTSPHLTRLYVAPGNGGTALLPKTENVDISASNLDGLATFARDHAVELAIVGPEAPLVAGVVDRFQAEGIQIFGPNQAAAQLEGSKAFSKAFMQRHDIPTGSAEAFTDFDMAMRYLRQLDDVPVVKASGLAAGKGVIVPASLEGAAAAVSAMLLDKRFGKASETVLIEERLTGPEMSVLAFCDGNSCRVMPVAQDHKRLLDGDHGPNTGGMGAFAPAPLATPELLADIERTVLLPTLKGMAAEGMPYVGVLYAGLMLTPQGPKVLEFNCRFGDPETQVLLPLLESDLLEICLACVQGRLDTVEPRWLSQAAVTVVMASKGYPDDYATGMPITGLDAATEKGCLVYHAGTRLRDGTVHTAGGRVLAVTALGRTVAQAAHHAYEGVRLIHFNGAHFRRDIGPAKPHQAKKRTR